MKLNAKEILKPTMILTVICLAVAVVMALANMATEDKIAGERQKKAEESRRIVLMDADSFEESGDYYIGKKDGAVVGYVFETEAKGYGGTVRVMTGILDGGSISGVVVLSHGETPGLGANAENENFRERYIQALPEGDLQVIKNKPSGGGVIEAMTGATITSRAVTDAVNRAAEQYREIAEVS